MSVPKIKIGEKLYPELQVALMLKEQKAQILEIIKEKIDHISGVRIYARDDADEAWNDVIDLVEQEKERIVTAIEEI